MRPSAVQLGQLIIVFAMAKAIIWWLTFLGAAGAFGVLIADLPLLLLSELVGAAIAILAMARILSPSNPMMFGCTVGAFQLLIAGVIELARLARVDFDWLLVSRALGVETVRPGWALGHPADIFIGGNVWGPWLPIVLLVSPFLSGAAMVLVVLRPGSMAVRPS